MFRNRSCTRVSSVSSGWKAATRSLPSRASTGWPSRLGENLDVRSRFLEPRRADEDRPQGFDSVPHVEIRLEAPHLAAERVAPSCVIAESEVVAVEDDHPRARPEDRPAELAHRVVEPVQPHQPADRGRLAPGDDQPVEPGELLGQPNLHRFGTEAPQHGRVLAEVPLHGQDTDPERLLHASMVTRVRRRATRPAQRSPNAGRRDRAGRARGRGGRTRAPTTRKRPKARSSRASGQTCPVGVLMHSCPPPLCRDRPALPRLRSASRRRSRSSRRRTRSWRAPPSSSASSRTQSRRRRRPPPR